MRLSSRYTLALQILCLCDIYKDQKITSNFIARKTGADPSIIRSTILELKKRDYLSSKPGPGGTTLNVDLKTITLYDVYELMEDPNEPALHFYDAPITCTDTDMALRNSSERIFGGYMQEFYENLKNTTLDKLCNKS